MECREVQEKMMDFIRQELTDQETEQFMSHIDSCPECYEELQISYSLFLGLRMLEQDQEDSFHIQNELDTFLQETRDKIFKRHILKELFFWLTVLAAFGVVVFFALQITRVLNPGLFHQIITFGQG